MKIKSKLIIEPLPRMYPANHVVCRARILRGRKSRVLWFRLPIEHEKSLTDSADSFLLASLLLAMSYHCDIHVKGTVSPSLIDNLHSFQKKFVEWWPHIYSYSRITADNMSETRHISDSRSTVIAFSGGIDSSYSLYRHVQNLGDEPHFSISSALMVHGFDIPLQQTEAFNTAFVKTNTISESLDVSLIPVATNLRYFPVFWHHVFGTAIATVMTLFARTFENGLIASGHQSTPYISEGSHPETDHFLSSNSFSVIHDGDGVTRLDKLRMLQSWPEFLKDLRVCWAGPDKAANCGECEKCIRTILFFRLLGVSPACFPGDVTDRQIARMKIPYFALLNSYQVILRYIRDHNIQESWVSALTENVSRHKSKFRLRMIKWRMSERMPFPLYEKIYRANIFFNEWRSQVPRYDE